MSLMYHDGNAKCNCLKVPTFSIKKKPEIEFEELEFSSQDLRATNLQSELQSVK